jgi:hypothetical protein
MPLRIAIAGVIAIAACVAVPISVSTVSSGSEAAASTEGGEPPEPYPSTAPAATIASDGLAGATVSAAGYNATRSWSVLLVLIAAGFIPSLLMIARSTRRNRAGPTESIVT